VRKSGAEEATVPQFDRSSKWLIEHHGASLLRLAGFGPARSCKALHAEVVQPGQLPDGLLEAHLEGAEGPRLFLVEIATYPETRTIRQLARDALLTYLDRELLPEVVALVLHPRGRLRVARGMETASPSGETRLELTW